MTYYDITRTLLIKIANIPEDKIDELQDFLKNTFSRGDWDSHPDLASKDYPLVFTYTEHGTETWYPGVYTLPNGDPGYPDEYEDDLEVDDYLMEEEILNFCRANSIEDVDYDIDMNDTY